jgi:hypothetical protein
LNRIDADLRCQTPDVVLMLVHHLSDHEKVRQRCVCAYHQICWDCGCDCCDYDFGFDCDHAVWVTGVRQLVLSATSRDELQGPYAFVLPSSAVDGPTLVALVLFSVFPLR